MVRRQPFKYVKEELSDIGHIATIYEIKPIIESTIVEDFVFKKIMKYLIKIDRSSIKKNPQAGLTYYIIPFADEWLVDGEPYFGPTDIDTLKTLISEHKTISKNQKYQRLETLSPQPDYFYDYVKTLVKCDYCHKHWLHTDLINDWSEYGDVEIINKCPKCDSWECCELEYEKLTDEILKEAKLI